MITPDSSRPDRLVFGVPAVLTNKESLQLLEDLNNLWVTCYGRAPAELAKDIQECRKYFDPVARGLTLRERLSRLEPVADDVSQRIRQYGAPLIVDAGEGVLLVGVEARFMIDLLTDVEDAIGDHIVLAEAQVVEAERKAMHVYREWATTRLRQVIDLRTGQGREPMQPVAVGVVLALLINRSHSPSQAVAQWDNHTSDGKDVDAAIYAGAEAFAAALTPGRSGRSAGERRLKGGYALTEARRRLAHRLVMENDKQLEAKLIYVPEEYRSAVVTFIARDLARRPKLTVQGLEAAFDALLHSFRASANALSYRGMTFERAAETRDLKQQLVGEFSNAQETTKR